MRTLPVVLVLALLGGAGIWFYTTASEGARSAAELEAESRRAADEAEARGEEDGGGAPGAAIASGRDGLTPAVLARLKALGFEVDVPDGHCLLVGRVLGKLASKPGEKEEERTEVEPAPLAGAKVELFRMGDDGIADTVAEVAASSREDGHFLATVAKGWSYRTRASAPGFVPGSRDLARATLRDGAIELGDIVLNRAVRVLVRVTTGNQEINEEVLPVAGMKISIKKSLEDEEELAVGETNDRGELLVSGLPVGDVLLSGELAPYAVFAAPHAVTHDGQEIEQNVDIVGRVRVRVRTPGGAPIKTFAVALDFRHNTYGYRAPSFNDVTTEDDEGWHVIEGVKVGEHDLYATAAGFAVGQVSPLEVKAGETTEATVDLPIGFRVRGRVVTRGGDRPVAGAIVFSEKDLIPSSVDTNDRKRFRPMARATKTDNRGEFTLEDLTEGTHGLSAIHPEHATKTVKAIKVGKDGDDNVTIKVPSGATLSGHVYGENGGPVSGTMVMVVSITDRNMKKKVPLMSTTDKEGYYRIEHVPSGFMGVIKLVTRPKPGEQPFEMQMKSFKNDSEVVVDFGDASKGTLVNGRVTDTEGKPVTTVIVMLTSVSGLVSGGIPNFFQGPTDGKGNYSISGVKPGAYQVQIAKAKKGSDFAGVERITVPESGTLTHDMVLAGGSVEGTVVSKTTGKGLDRGEVVLLQEGRFCGRLDLDPGGKYNFFYVPVGTYDVVATGADHGPQHKEGVTVRAGELTRVPKIELLGGGRIVGEVKGTTGQPVEGAMVYLIDPKTGEALPTWVFPTLEDGTFEAPYVPAGTYKVSARLGQRTFEEVSVEIAVAGVATVVVSERP